MQIQSGGRHFPAMFVVSALCAVAASSQSRADDRSVPMRHTAGRVYSLSFSPDGRYLASAGEDQYIRVWELKSGTEVLKKHFFHPVRLTFHPNGQTIYCARGESFNPLTGEIKGRISIINVQSGAEEDVVPAGPFVMALAVSPDGRTFASATIDMKPPDFDVACTMWDIRSRERLASVKVHTSTIVSLGYSPDGTMLALGGGPGGADDLMIWKRGADRPQRIERSDLTQVSDVAFLPDGRTLVSLTYDHVKLWDVRTGKLKRTIEDGNLAAMAISPDGRMLVAVGYDLSFWDIKTGERTFRLTKTPYNFRSVSISPDGKLVATGCDDSTIRLWDARTGAPVRVGGAQQK